jgi:hypothetical protein
MLAKSIKMFLLAKFQELNHGKIFYKYRIIVRISEEAS